MGIGFLRRNASPNLTGGVLKSLKAMQQDYRPTYENRARFDVLCNEAVARMKVRNTPTP